MLKFAPLFDFLGFTFNVNKVHKVLKGSVVLDQNCGRWSVHKVEVSVPSFYVDNNLKVQRNLFIS